MKETSRNQSFTRYDHMGYLPVANGKILDLCSPEPAKGSVSSDSEKQTAVTDAANHGVAEHADLRDVRRTLQGDSESYRSLLERNQDMVSAMMWRFSRDRTVHEELVQNVFVEVYLSLDTYREKAPFTHWLTKVATRVGYQYWKKQAKERSFPTVSFEEWHRIPEVVTTDQNIFDALDPLEAGELLHKLLGQLPPRDRLILTLRYVEDHSVKETSRLTGLSQTMVKVQTLRARTKLKKLLKKIMDGTDHE